MVAKVVLACLFGKSHSLEHKYRRIRDPKIFFHLLMIQKKTSHSIIKSICEGGTYGLGSAQSGINHW